MDSLLVGIRHSIGLRCSNDCQLDADLHGHKLHLRAPTLRWAASSEPWTASDRNGGRDQIRTLGAIASEYLGGFRRNLQIHSYP